MTETWPPKGLTRAVSDIAKGSGWTAWSGTLSKVEKATAFHIYEFAGHLNFLAKPVAWDACLWRVLDIAPPHRHSPSRHFRGAKAPVPAIARRRLQRRDVAGIAREILAFADMSCRGVDVAELADFPALMRQGADQRRPDDFKVTEVIWHLTEGRVKAAREIAKAIVSGQRRASYSVGVAREGRRCSFFQAVLDETNDEAV